MTTMVEKYLRKSIEEFGHMMELKLQLNEHKGIWDNCSSEEALRLAEKNLKQAKTKLNKPDGEFPISDVIDVANYCMIMYDNWMKRCAHANNGVISRSDL